MINKKGQTLILFVFLLPLIIGIMAFVVDIGLIMSKTTNLKEVTKLIIHEGIEKDLTEEEIHNLFVKNKIDIDNLKLNVANKEIEVNNKIEINSIFGSIIGIKKYEIKVNLKGYINNNKIVID